MWIFKYLICLVKNHNWVGSGYRYCLRCGKLTQETVTGELTEEGNNLASQGSVTR